MTPRWPLPTTLTPPPPIGAYRRPPPLPAVLKIPITGANSPTHHPHEHKWLQRPGHRGVPRSLATGGGPLPVRAASWAAQTSVLLLARTKQARQPCYLLPGPLPPVGPPLWQRWSAPSGWPPGWGSSSLERHAPHRVHQPPQRGGTRTPNVLPGREGGVGPRPPPPSVAPAVLDSFELVQLECSSDALGRAGMRSSTSQRRS